MTYTQDEIAKMLELSKQHVVMIDKLTPYCNVIANLLGFDSTDGVWVGTTDTGDHISFIAEWHGAYQAENRESFAFPAAWLVKPAEEVAQILMQQVKHKLKEAQDHKDKCLKEKKLLDYLKLKSEFET